MVNDLCGARDGSGHSLSAAEAVVAQKYVRILMTQGDWIGLGHGAPERLAAQLDTVRDRAGEAVPPHGSAQGAHEVARALAKLG